MLGLVYQSRALFAHYLLPVKDLLFQEPCGALEQEKCLDTHNSPGASSIEMHGAEIHYVNE